ncbi:MAG: ABC transporter substrate-binding protein [Faecousia sp.]
MPDDQDQTGATASVPRIVVTFPITSGVVTDGIGEVQDAINAITVPEIGVEIELLIVDASKTSVLYPNKITKGEQIDLMVLNNEDVHTYAKQEMVLPLDTLLEHLGEGILEIDKSYTSLLSVTELNGQFYGVAIPSESVGQCGGLWTTQALLDQVSFHYEPEKIYSLAELDVLFSRIKQAYPDSYPLGQITNSYSFSTSSFYLGIWCDGLTGGDPGVLELGSTQIVNQYELPQYVELLQYMRKWYQAGYIYPDSAITSTTGLDLYASGMVKSIPLVGTPYFLTEDVLGEDPVCLRLSPVYIIRRGSAGVFWTIPATSKDPEAAMRFLNMMYTDERIINLLSWGIRDRDYILEEDGTFRQAEQPQFCSSLGLFGDQRLRYEINGEERKAARAEFSGKAVAINPEYDGFVFDTSGLHQELTRIDQLKSEYLKLLESGCVDFDTVYPEFIQKLYDAGLQRVLDEKQRQFDIFLEEES